MIDAQTMRDNNSEVEEFSQQEETLHDHEIENKDSVRKIIKKYQNKINGMLKVIQKQKKQNDSLKSELKTLNENLNSMIDKLSHKNIKDRSPSPPRDEVLKRQLQNQIKINANIHKEVQQLRMKLKAADLNRVNELQNQVKEKNRKIEELTQKVKLYEKIEKQEKNTDIYKREEQSKHQMNLLNEQIQHLKNKLAQSKKQQEFLQKKMKKQHEQILSLDAKAKGTQNAQSKSAPFKQRYESGQSSQNRNSDRKLHEQIAELRQKCENLEVTKKAAEKHLRHEAQLLKNKNNLLQKEVEELRNVLKRKQKQANILVHKMKESQKKNYNTLQPMEKLKISEEFGTTGLFDQRKQFKGLVHIQGNFRKFDDTEGLSLQKNYRIKSFVFTWFQEHILSLQTVYELRDGSQRPITSFEIAHQHKNVKHGGLELGQFEYLKDIQVYCGKFIEFMRIQTSRDRILEVGNEKNHTKCKKFTFDIRTNQKPIAFLGAIDNKKVLGVETSRELLISFGLEIKKKDVMGKTRFNPIKTHSLNKFSSKSALDRARNNDKNVINEES